MLSKIFIFIITALVFYGLGKKEGAAEYKERVKKAIESSNSINNVKIRLRIK